jgi:hypothetical protein
MDGNRFFRFGLLLCAGTFILICLTKSFAQSSADDDIHISAIAEFYAVHTYSHLKGHKAFAVGPGGYWANSSDKPSAKSATKAALKSCTAAYDLTIHDRSGKSLMPNHSAGASQCTEKLLQDAGYRYKG